MSTQTQLYKINIFLQYTNTNICPATIRAINNKHSNKSFNYKFKLIY
jgi:hypothetical protein